MCVCVCLSSFGTCIYRFQSLRLTQCNHLTAYHPQTDGTTEHVNQEIEAYLSIYCASHPEEWPQTLHTLEFTHNNRRHADRRHTLSELMFGESPIAIPLSFENTKYPLIEERMTTLLQNREEALATHELARSCIADRWKSMFTPFKLGDQVWLDSRNLKNNLSQKDEAKMRRTVHHYWSTGTSDLSAKTTEILANSRCLPCHLATIIQGKQNLQWKFYGTTTGITGRRRSLRGRNNPQPLKERMRLPILCQIARISHHRCLVETRTCILGRWRYAKNIQNTPQPLLNNNTPF